MGRVETQGAEQVRRDLRASLGRDCAEGVQARELRRQTREGVQVPYDPGRARIPAGLGAGIGIRVDHLPGARDTVASILGQQPRAVQVAVQQAERAHDAVSGSKDLLGDYNYAPTGESRRTPKRRSLMDGRAGLRRPQGCWG